MLIHRHHSRGRPAARVSLAVVALVTTMGQWADTLVVFLDSHFKIGSALNADGEE